MKILIDNGHGSNTPGKRSPNGSILEYKYTREIAQRVVDELKARGYDAERIVTEDYDVSLGERCRRVNAKCKAHGSHNVLLVSIHNNAAGAGGWMNARGWSAYTTKGRTLSDALADCLYKAAESYLIGQKIRKDTQDGDPDWEENFYILRNTLCAAVLTENFFMDNREDVAYLLSEAGKMAIVKVHVEGIIAYIKSQKG
ncbi:N-acetylmuramoyl-L-alanine amidase [Porphyromonas endodontalis]|uniref:N-acetylmuramoyl-L-alanine amidase n=1 Tax=Porphyromonas endodontalis TaxID=28124 RepID=UPI0028EF9605|nr:N-acetylmuramoyl-L-alanine amidase [Porphyromonas endodontalis]